MHCYLLLLLSLLSFDQFKQETDSVKVKQAIVNSPDTTKVFGLLRLAELSYASNMNAAKAYSKSATQLAEKTHNTKCITLAYLQEGSRLWSEKKTEFAFRQYHIALEYAIKSGSDQDRREAYHQIGTRYSENGQSYQAIQYLYQALQLTNPDHLPNAYAYTLFELGKVNAGINNYPEAIDYYKRCSDFTEKSLKDNHLRALSNNGIGLVYDNQGNFKSAIVFYRKAYEITKREARLEELGGNILGNMGYLYSQSGNTNEAINCLKADLAIASKYKNFSSVLSTSLVLAKIYSKVKDVKTTYYYVHIADSMQKLVNNPSIDFSICRNYAYIYENLGELDKSIGYFKKAFSDINKFYSPKNIDEIATMQTQHRIAFNQKELELLKKSKQLDEANFQKVKRNNQLLLISLVFLVVVIVFVFVLLRQKVRSNTMLSDKTKIIAEQNSLVSISNNRLQEVNRQKTEIIGVVSHDLKAPVNRIKGLLDLLSLDIRNRDEYINMMMISINDANNLIQNLLDNSSLEEGKSSLRPTEFDLVTLLNSIIKVSTPQANYKNISILTEFQVGSLIVENDKLALTRVVENLVSNALKFSPKNTGVTVKLELTHNAHCVISVTDNGPGISIDDQKRVFKPFTKLTATPTAGESSTGLGLSIVHKLVALMHGSIEIFSDFGSGATFVVTLPIQVPKQAA